MNLGLAEVGGDPQFAGLRERHELLARLHTVTDVDRFPADDAVSGRDDLRVAEVQLRLVELRPRQLQVRAADLHGGFAHAQLPRRVLPDLPLMRQRSKASTRKVMKARIEYAKAAPQAVKAMLDLEAYVRGCGLEPSLLELVRMRASQTPTASTRTARMPAPPARPSSGMTGSHMWLVSA